MEHNRNNTNRWDEWDNKSYRPQHDNRNRSEERRHDPEAYRGAYRQDTSSDHRPAMDRNRQHSQNDFNRHDQSDWHSGRNPRQATNYNQEWEDRTRQEDYRRTGGRFRDDWQDNNFNEDYAPDYYRHRRGENAGNMAGSLSFGYDGDRNSNPDAYRRYDPLSGEIRKRPAPSRNQDQNPDYTAGQQNARERWGHY